MPIERFVGDYDFLSNFYPSPISLDGHLYQTAEHAFQAQKATSDGEREWVASAPTPGGAKQRGKRVRLRDDWNQVRLDIMYRVVKAKFDQNPDIKERLLETEYEPLVEGNTWNDKFWGVCNGKGENHLGKILMKVRHEIRNPEAQDN